MTPGTHTTGIRRRLRDWALRRQGPDLLPLTLSSRRVYIVPTRAGWVFALLIMVTFIAGMNYGNGLALLLTFWLTGFALTAMVQTQRMLASLRLPGASAMPAFAGERVLVSLQVDARGAVADLSLRCDQGTPVETSGEAENSTVQLAITANRRGPWQAPPLQLVSTAPFGLFHTWTWLKPDIATVVYPRPVGGLAPPETAGEDGGSANMVNTQDELAWLRDFREGDSPRQVAWKAYARGAPLLVREYRGHAAARREFDFSTLQLNDIEGRLSQLARWCVDAAARGEHWTLCLPGSPPITGTGPAHLEVCLRRLALHGVRRDIAT